MSGKLPLGTCAGGCGSGAGVLSGVYSSSGVLVVAFASFSGTNAISFPSSRLFDCAIDCCGGSVSCSSLRGVGVCIEQYNQKFL